MFLVRITTPPLAALYVLPPSVPARPSTLAMFTMAPRSPSTGSWASIAATACFPTRNVPLRLMSTTRSHSSAGTRCTGPPPATPAACTTASRRPSAVTTEATAPATAASSRTSTTVSAPSRSQPTTVAPSAAKRCALAAPMPDAAPVITAILPSMRPIGPPKAMNTTRYCPGGLAPSSSLGAHDVDGLRPLLRDPGPPAVGSRQRPRRVPEHDRAGGGRRDRGLRVVLDRRAPLPRRVLTLLRAGCALRRDRGAHHHHAHRPRRPAPPLPVQPPGARRGGRSRRRPRLRRPARIRPRSGVHPRGTRGLRGRSEPPPRPMGGGPAPRRTRL